MKAPLFLFFILYYIVKYAFIWIMQIISNKNAEYYYFAKWRLQNTDYLLFFVK